MGPQHGSAAARRMCRGPLHLQLMAAHCSRPRNLHWHRSSLLHIRAPGLDLRYQGKQPARRGAKHLCSLHRSMEAMHPQGLLVLRPARARTCQQAQGQQKAQEAHGGGWAGAFRNGAASALAPAQALQLSPTGASRRWVPKEAAKRGPWCMEPGEP